MTTSIRRFCVCAVLMSSVALAQLNFVPLTIHVQRADGSPIRGANVDAVEVEESWSPRHFGPHYIGRTDLKGDYHFVGSIQKLHEIKVVAKGFAVGHCDELLLSPRYATVVTVSSTSAKSVVTQPCIRADKAKSETTKGDRMEAGTK